jgi:hypothetical protein
MPTGRELGGSGARYAGGHEGRPEKVFKAVVGTSGIAAYPRRLCDR